MKHFTTAEWIDFANGTLPAGPRQELGKHLAGGCRSCEEAARLWRRVRQAAKAQKSYQPPSEVLRIAKAAFVFSPLALGRNKACTFPEKVFDTFLVPLCEGARSSPARGARQLLYRADPYQVDMQIERGEQEGTLIITGQLLDLRQPGFAGRHHRVVISNLRGAVAQTVTNQQGEFRQEIPDSGELEVVFPGLAERPLIISLRDALGESVERARARSSKA